MPILIRAESEIRELFEKDTLDELRLDALAQQAHALHGHISVNERLDHLTAQAQRLHSRIVADRRLDRHDLPDLLALIRVMPGLLRLVCQAQDLIALIPPLCALVCQSLDNNRQINTAWGRLSTERRLWGKPPFDDDPEPIALQEAA